MAEAHCPTQERTLRELDSLAPEAPFLALGQTVFWDEPMKGVVLQAARRMGSQRRFVAGVHDTDYFAKFPGKATRRRGFQALPHNDTTTKGLWSAAGEFSALFGSETVVSRDELQRHGAKVARVAQERPGYLDEVTEAWGWRGIVSFNPGQRTTAEKPLGPLFPELYDTLDWAIQESLRHISGPHRRESEAMGQKLLAMLCDAAGDREGRTLAQCYEALIPELYSQVAGERLELEATATSRLLALTPENARRPRFDLVNLFLNPATRTLAEAAYNDAVAGSEIYPLDRFGVGALPFDVMAPGRGRGTLRIGTRGGVIMTPEPIGFSFKKPPETAEELAEMLERRLGPGSVLIGKAVTLIGMLAREFVFVFHEGASSYVHRSRSMHQRLAAAGHALALNPILRVEHRPWDAMEECCAWLTLPEPLRRPFGVEELSAPSFALRWREVQQAQTLRLQELDTLRRPLDLIRWLQKEIGGHWQCLGSEYERIHDAFGVMKQQMEEIRVRRREALAEIREINQKVDEAQKAVGDHWRARIFDLNPSQDDFAEREHLIAKLKSLRESARHGWLKWRALKAEQEALLASDELDKARRRRTSISLEAELMRMKLIREAVVATQGLDLAGRRPSAWWFPLVCPDGAWHRAAARRARFHLEPLI